MKRCILCSSDKDLSNKVLEYLLSRDIYILYVVVEHLKQQGESSILDTCLQKKIQIIEGAEIGNLQDIDNFEYLLSFNYALKIPEWLISKANIALNFHPAPLPEYQGCAPSSWGIINKEKEWGVTCHYLNGSFDKGDLVEIDKFVIDTKVIKTGYDLSNFAWEKSYNQFLRIIDDLLNGKNIARKIQGRGCYYSRRDLECVKIINSKMSVDEINQRIRGLWNPPYEGAYIEINNQKFYLIDQHILDECGLMYKNHYQYIKKDE